MKYTFLILILSTFFFSTHCLLSKHQLQSAIDISSFSCHSCLTSNSIYWCNNGTSSGCCSGSNFFVDKCGTALKRSYNCTNYIGEANLRYAACSFNQGVCGLSQQWIQARDERQEIKISGNVRGSIDGQACSYRIRRDDDGQGIIVRFVQIQNLIVHAITVDGWTAQDRVLNSKQIQNSGSNRFKLGQNHTLFLNIVVKNKTSSLGTFQIYSIGQQHYEIYLKNFAIAIFSSTLGLYLVLVATQRCRIVNDKHQLELAEYFQRKELFKQFESEEIFRKHQQFEGEIQPINTQILKKAVAGYDTYYRNERGGSINNQNKNRNMKKQSIMMNQVLQNKGNIEEEQDWKLQRASLKQKNLQNNIIRSSVTQLFDPHRNEQQRLSIQNMGLNHHQTQNEGMTMYSERNVRALNREQDNDYAIQNRRMGDEYFRPTFPEEAGAIENNGPPIFQAVDVSQNLPYPQSYREQVEPQFIRELEDTQPISSQRMQTAISYGSRNNMKPQSRLQTILKNHIH